MKRLRVPAGVPSAQERGLARAPHQILHYCGWRLRLRGRRESRFRWSGSRGFPSLPPLLPMPRVSFSRSQSVRCERWISLQDTGRPPDPLHRVRLQGPGSSQGGGRRGLVETLWRIRLWSLWSLKGGKQLESAGEAIKETSGGGRKTQRRAGLMSVWRGGSQPGRPTTASRCCRLGGRSLL